MDNQEIAKNFKQLAKILELKGESAFRFKSYINASELIKQLPRSIETYSEKEIRAMSGIGPAIMAKIKEQISSGQMSKLEEERKSIPAGVLEMMQIRGISMPRLATIWREAGIETPEMLQDACQKGRISRLHGFGEKTERQIHSNTLFYIHNRGCSLLSSIQEKVYELQNALFLHYGKERFQLCGDMLRQLEIIREIEWVTSLIPEDLENFLKDKGLQKDLDSTEDRSIYQDLSTGNRYIFKQEENAEKCRQYRFLSSMSQAFKQELIQITNGDIELLKEESELDYFRRHHLSPLRAGLREYPFMLKEAYKEIQYNDIRGIIHCHSAWSDGILSIEEMAKNCIKRAMEYMVITDHSVSAAYAHGLSIERVKAQWEEINELNKKLYPFHIFRGIECDILKNGNLDYPNDLLSEFDMVIASVHAALSLDIKSETDRILKAIENPYTTMIGHLTGRLLTKREGMALDMEKILTHCAKHNTDLEINTNPYRLDLSRDWIRPALERSIKLSLNPDAHRPEGLDDLKWGIISAAKAGLRTEDNISCLSFDNFSRYLKEKKKLKSQ